VSEGKPFSEAGRNRREASAAHQDSVIRKWGIYGGTGIPPERPFTAEIWPPPPPWRSFTGGPLNPPPPDDAGDADRRIGPAASGPGHASDPQEVAAVNAAISLRRPLLVTGAPGVGKSSLGYRIARELGLGRVLRWAITSRSTLRLGLYDYDAIGRAQNAGLRARWHQQAGEPVSMDVNESERAAAADIGDYLQLGPLGTALLPYSIPRVLLIDELDKSDIDLPNDLLHVFEEGEYTVRELDRVRALMPVVEVHTDDPGRTAKITEGRH
jgi:MoxR-like ATPase